MIVVITGATSGFGAAITHRFAGKGHQIVAIGRRAERLDALRQSLGDCILSLPLDVTDRDAVCAAIATLPAEFAAVDILVNNAGLALGLEPAHRASLDDWDAMIDTNAKGLVYVTHALLPGWWSAIAGTSSIWAVSPRPTPIPAGTSMGQPRHLCANSRLTCALISPEREFG